MGFKTTRIEMDKLILSPSLSAEYRRTILGLAYRASSLSQISAPMLLDYIMAHPPVGRVSGTEFHVVANVRTLAIKPFLPGDTLIPVIVDDHADRQDIVLASAYREMIALVVSGMTNRQYQYAVVALWELFLEADQSRQLAVASKRGLGPIVGLRRQALSEVSIRKQTSGPVVEGAPE